MRVAVARCPAPQTCTWRRTLASVPSHVRAAGNPFSFPERRIHASYLCCALIKAHKTAVIRAFCRIWGRAPLRRSLREVLQADPVRAASGARPRGTALTQHPAARNLQGGPDAQMRGRYSHLDEKRYVGAGDEDHRTNEQQGDSAGESGAEECVGEERNDDQGDQNR